VGVDLDVRDEDYQLRIKTPKRWRGTEQTLAVTFDDGTTHTTTFAFR
jgi:hypothetical protein